MATATKKTKAPSFDSMLNASTVETSSFDKKKKSDAPKMPVPENIAENLKKFSGYKKDMKDAEGNMRVEESPILEFCMTYLDDKALVGDYHSSYEITDTDGISSKFITCDSFTLPTDPEILNQVKELIGEDEFEKLTEETIHTALKPEVFTDDTLKKDLMTLIGREFPRFFETTKTRSLKSGFAEKMYELAKTKERLLSIKALVPQKKPSIR